MRTTSELDALHFLQTLHSLWAGILHARKPGTSSFQGSRREALAGQRGICSESEALARLVRKELLRRTNECVFGFLALESEPVDSRL